MLLLRHLLSRYFRQTKLTSFQRQLNLYGFNRITRGPDSGAYYSEFFLRWRVFLCKHMIRTKVKGTRFKAASNPEHEPDFYTMPTVAPLGSDSTQCNMSRASSSSTDSYAPAPIPLQSCSLEKIPFVGSTPEMKLLSNSLSQFLASSCKADPLPMSLVDVVVKSEDFLDSEDLDTLDNLSLDWDESFDSAFEMSLKDDIQLGFMLDKLLED
jgi:HSF-type DNA-binding